LSKKLFVGNLSFQTTENHITDAFARCGAVETVSIITDRDTGRSKGFGFITISEEDADKAIAQLNGSQLDGRALTVWEKHPEARFEFETSRIRSTAGRLKSAVPRKQPSTSSHMPVQSAGEESLSR
jgi:cold-inducible RNA-binding protein